MNLILKFKRFDIGYRVVDNNGEDIPDTKFYKTKEELIQACEKQWPAGKRVQGGFMIPVRYMFDRDDIKAGKTVVFGNGEE